MDSFFVRYKNALVLIAIVLVQTIALAVQVQRPATGYASNTVDGKHTTLLRAWTAAVVTPVERLLHGTTFDVRRVWSNYIGLRQTHQQNQALKHEVDRLRLEQTEFAEEAAEGRRLQKLLVFQQQYVANTVPAQVIGTSGTDGSRVLTLDRGSDYGLKPEQAVMTPDGVVGKLRDVFAHTSQLLLLDDRTSGAGVILESTRIRGILRGTVDGKVEIDNLTADSRIKVGEKVLTSGGDEVFPRGLPVGVIESIAADPNHQPYTAIVVKPAADLSRLEEVLVITGTQSDLPAEAQKDAAVADAAAQENERAADLIAQKLPGLKNDAAKTGAAGASGATGSTGTTGTAADPDQTGGVPGIPSSGVPRVKPALHPDRYSPGATPPAEDLQPGAPNTAEPPQ